MRQVRKSYRNLGPVMGSFEHDNESSYFLKDEEYLCLLTSRAGLCSLVLVKVVLIKYSAYQEFIQKKFVPLNATCILRSCQYLILLTVIEKMRFDLSCMYSRETIGTNTK
jgi:hypothetical protein